MGSVLGSCCGSMCATMCCSCAGSVCNSCLGNNKSSSDAPSLTSGRKRSVFLIVISLGLSLFNQYAMAPALSPSGGALTDLPYTGQYTSKAWNGGCEDLATEILQDNCRGNSGVYRVGTVTFLYFLFSAMSAYCRPTSNREGWFAKLVLYLCTVVAFIFVPNVPLLTDIYMQTSRIGGAIFIVAQQIIFLDISYNLNDALVEKANNADAIEPGTGKKWLTGIVVMCAILFLGSITVIGFLYGIYSGCPSNDAFISTTLILLIVVTAVQMSGEESSLLTSASLSAYGVYLCFLAVSKNPNEICNPYIKEKDTLGIVLGLLLIVFSLAWTGWSNTADKRLLSETKEESDKDVNPRSRDTGGIVISDEEQNYGTANTQLENDESNSVVIEAPATWKINVILLLLSCWISMVLTGWGSIQGGGNLANPDVHNISMWMIIASQWLMFALYFWTLIAAKVFPDRDFS